MLVVHRRRWTGEAVDLVNFYIERERHIVSNDLKKGII